MREREDNTHLTDRRAAHPRGECV